MQPQYVLLGFVAQYTIMPLLASKIAAVAELGPALSSGLILVGCAPGTLSSLINLIPAHLAAPNLFLSHLISFHVMLGMIGGTASNLVTLIARADVALSVTVQYNQSSIVIKSHKFILILIHSDDCMLNSRRCFLHACTNESTSVAVCLNRSWLFGKVNHRGCPGSCHRYLL